MKKARLIITFDCPRKCSYCCNTYKKIMEHARFTDGLEELTNYDEIMITGGEPSTPGRRVGQQPLGAASGGRPTPG